MRVAVFSAKPYDQDFLDAANDGGHRFTYLASRLDPATVRLAAGNRAVCAFVNDELNRSTIDALAELGVELIALRCAGYNNVDLAAAEQRGLAVVHVPAYSPYAVAEHAVGLILALNRKIHRAYVRVREHNFSLEGLLGFDLRGRTVGVIGAGRIGEAAAGILLHGFGCRVLFSDPKPNPQLCAAGAEPAPIETLLSDSSIVTLHCPLTPATHHLVDAAALELMQPGAMLINTSRGALVDTRAAIASLKSQRLGALGIDVYEEEAGIFYTDRSDDVLRDDVLARLLTFPNVLITGHQGYFTDTALRQIAACTLASLTAHEAGLQLDHEIRRV
ncbi:MAG: 2-hydroxyacid dehydrogenase [Acidimicrobiales bacterium]